MNMLTDMWKKIFSIAKLVDNFEKPLTPKILSNPNNYFVQILIYIYSMESFVYSEMNRTSRMKVEENIKYYGAFASALGFAIHCGGKTSSKI